jgi:peptide deformylase
MAILPILEAPHPILEKKTREVRADEFNAELVTLLEDMAITMYAAPGVGLAAPQIGDSRRILVADPGNDEDDAPRRLFSMVNPKIISHSEELISYEESCLSVPEFYLNVKRFKQIAMEWKDGNGTVHRDIFEGFPSIVLQHELDHLEGKTLLARSSRLRRSRYISRQKKKRKAKGKT